MRLMTVVGTRPEIIRLSRVMARADEEFDHVVVHTGQNWDRKLSGIFFDELGLRAPDRRLDTDTGSLGRFVGSSMAAIEETLLEVRPDAFLVLGDTNSALTSIMAKRLRIPVYHMEAGNRCFDANVPEETNRRIVDHTADINLAYTEHARRNLLAEGLHPRRVYVTGSPMREVLDFYADRYLSSDVLHRLGLEPRKYYVVSAHREENVDDPERLSLLVQGLEALAEGTGLPVIVSTHPRTRRNLTAGRAPGAADVRFLEPFGFFDYIALQRGAAWVLSDSGTISEESAMLGFGAATLRPAIERPEALDAGTIRMCGLSGESMLAAVRGRYEPAPAPAEYTVTNTSSRVVNIIASTAPFTAEWSGLRRREAAAPLTQETPGPA